MTDKLHQIEELVTPAAEALGFEIVRVSIGGGGRVKLQIMAERADGSMTVDDCAALSREVSAVLDVEDPISGEYMLEVSSPGIDRPLTRLKDFERFAGFEAKLERREAIEGRRRFRGRLEGVESGSVVLRMEDETVAIPFEEIDKAKLVLTDELLAAAGH